jgi:hypothetical protein
MNEEIKHVIEQLPDKAPPSKLEPFRDLISQLRRKRYTYREIATFLRQQANLDVHWTTVNSFVRVRARQRRLQFELPQTATTAVAGLPLPRPSQPASRPPTPNAPTKPFHFDPSKGLTLSDEVLNLKSKKD